MSNPQFTPKDILPLIKRRKTAFLVPAITVFLISLIIAFILPAAYKSTATILIEEQELPQNFVMATVTSFAEQRIEMIKQRIMSYSNLLSLINHHALYTDLKNKWATEQIVEKMRNDIHVQTISVEVMDKRTGRPTATTIAFTLSYEGENPGKVHKITSALSTLFLEENLKVRTQQTKEATRFLEDEMNKVKKNLTDLNLKLSDFKGENLHQLPEFLQVNLQLLAASENNLIHLNEQLKISSEREKYFISQLSLMSPELEFNLDQKRLEDLKIHLVTLKSKFSDEYPDVKNTRKEIAKLKKQLSLANETPQSLNSRPENPSYINIKSELSGISSEIKSIKRQINDAIKKRNHYEALIGQSAVIEGDYKSLLADHANMSNKLNDLTQKLMEAQVAYGLEKDQKGEHFTLIDPARFPEKPFKPNRIIIIIIGFILSLGFSTGLVAILEFMNDAIYSPKSLAETTQIPVLGEIPIIQNQHDISLIKRKQIALAAVLITAPVIGTLFFHLFIMDLYIFWAKVARRLAL